MSPHSGRSPAVVAARGNYVSSPNGAMMRTRTQRKTHVEKSTERERESSGIRDLGASRVKSRGRSARRRRVVFDFLTHHRRGANSRAKTTLSLSLALSLSTRFLAGFRLSSFFGPSSRYSPRVSSIDRARFLSYSARETEIRRTRALAHTYAHTSARARARVLHTYTHTVAHTHTYTHTV